MSDQEPRLTEVQRLARGLHRDREELGESRDELTDSLAELHREPTATVELTEDQLQGLLELLNQIYEPPAEPLLGLTREQLEARDKFQQALAIESGPGGRFCDPA